MRARALMVLGTASHVGKSLTVAALCRIFHRHGVSVAPFKAQNMSLNSAATPDGLEIGRAQALQAEAAGLAPSVDMNPILLKPTGDMRSQVVVRGKVWGTLSAYDYHQRRVEELVPQIRQSYEALAARHEVIVLEGAGSPAEINLKQHDIVNMRMAEMAHARCLLVGDIDRGGVFAALLGTMQLLDPHEQARIAGFVINKFRGDQSLLTPGVEMIEQRIDRPCFGVVPHLHGLMLEEEDSLDAPLRRPGIWQDDRSPARALRVAVIALPTFANFTDFDALRAEPAVSLHFIDRPEQLAQADLIVLPGSKQTADDLLWLRERGLTDAIAQHAQASLLIGICGGMQMLGRSLTDDIGMERQGSFAGLGLLPIATTLRTVKVTSLAHGTLCGPALFGVAVSTTSVEGYEIHLGDTTYLEDAEPFARLARVDQPGVPFTDGCIAASGRVFGTYLHGLFDRDDLRHALIGAARSFHKLAPAVRLHDWERRRAKEIDRLADHFEVALDMNAIFACVGLDYVARESAV